MISLRSAPQALRCLLVAVLFAVCGAWSSLFFPKGGDKPAICLVPIPFAVLCALLFRRGAKTVLFVPLMLITWLAAHETARLVGMMIGIDESFAAVAVGGCMGGLGVALSVSICERRLLTHPYLFLAALVGCISALPFGPWATNYQLSLTSLDRQYYELRPFRLRYSFAIWQAAVGAYLYIVCKGPSAQISGMSPENGTTS